MGNIGTISVAFIANTSAFTRGLTGMRKDTVKFSNGLKKDMFSAGKDIAAIGKIAATAGTAIAAGIAAGVAKATANISKLVDEAGKIGVSSTQFQALSYAATTTGTDMETLKRGFTELQKTINDAAGGSESATTAFTRLGLSVDTLRTMSPDEQFKTVTQALSEVSDATERSTLGFEILGKTYTELTPMMSGGIKSLQDAANEAVKIGQVLGEEDNKNIKAMGENWEWLSNAVMGAFNMISAAIAPIFNSFVDGFKSSATEGTNFRDGVMLLVDVLATGVIVIAQIIDGIKAFIKLGSAGMSAVAGAIFAVIEGALKGINFLVQKWVSGINLMISAWNELPFTKQIAPIEFNLLDNAISEIQALREGSFSAMKEFGTEAGEAWSNGYASKVQDIVGKMHETLASSQTKAAADLGKKAAPIVPTTVAPLTKKTPTTTVDAELTSFFSDIDKLQAKNQRIRSSVLGDLVTPYQQYQAQLKYVQDLEAQHIITQDEMIAKNKQLTGEYTANYTFLGKATTQFVDGFADGFAEILRSGENFGSSLKSLFTNLLADIAQQWISNMIKMAAYNMLSNVGGGIGAMFSNYRSVASFGGKAAGGEVTAGVPTYVNERGNEIFIPSTSGTIIPHNKINNLGQKTTSIFNMYAYDTTGMQQMIDKNRESLAKSSQMYMLSSQTRRKV